MFHFLLAKKYFGISEIEGTIFDLKLPYYTKFITLFNLIKK